MPSPVVPVPVSALEIALQELKRNEKAFQNYLDTGAFEDLDIFMTFSAEVEALRGAIALIEESLDAGV